MADCNLSGLQLVSLGDIFQARNDRKFRALLLLRTAWQESGRAKVRTFIKAA
ncbi:hypothetical protein [Bordetella genomosp. 4]|uniref:hypothetical protein n=1 Tax=Bordetella genomosp. 4 TaxID=463044 RepID=UPI001594EA79|nr:hypothetical protein [Bordetella genomosp. 4]